MCKDVLLVTGADVLVINRLTGLGINPADVKRTVLQATVEVLDVAHHPGHLDAALNGEFTARLHFPSSAGTAPGTDLGEASDDNDLLEIDHTAQLRQLLQRLHGLKCREVKLEVGARSDIDCLKDTLGSATIDDLEIGGIIAGDGTTKLALLLQT